MPQSVTIWHPKTVSPEGILRPLVGQRGVEVVQVDAVQEAQLHASVRGVRWRVGVRAIPDERLEMAVEEWVGFAPAAFVDAARGLRASRMGFTHVEAARNVLLSYFDGLCEESMAVHWIDNDYGVVYSAAEFYRNFLLVPEWDWRSEARM